MTGVSGRVDGAATTLLCAPSMNDDATATCRALLRSGVDEGLTPLWVCYAGRPAVDTADVLPDGVEGSLLLAGDDAPSRREGPLVVETVSTASDLTAVGIALNRFLDAADGDLVVCFDSVTALLQYVDLETAYEFLHTVVAQLTSAGARAHFHVDPTAHDDATVDAVASLCDAVVDVSGDTTVRTRAISDG